MKELLFIPHIEKLSLTVTETAFYLNCSAGTVYHLIHKNVLPAYKQGREYRILTENLLRLISSRTASFDRR